MTDENKVLTRDWRAPTGAAIIGTAELTPGTALVTFHNEDDWEYLGQTKIDWNDQEGVTRAGQAVWVDENGFEWLECQLLKDPTEPLPETIVSPWDDLSMIRRHLDQILDEVAMTVMADRRSGDTAPGQEDIYNKGKDMIAKFLLQVRAQNA